MTLRFALDTNVLAEPLKATPNAGVMRKLQKHDGQLCIPTPVWHEMWFGCLRLPSGKRRRVIAKYLVDVLQPAVPLLPYSAEAAKWHAAQRARLIKTGRTPTFVDGQIAAVAVEHKLTLVTANLGDFKAYSDIKVVDWRSR
ncbi:MAG: type II toxin-antitoxin system VapC family toxin [Proteobacteria bacterium]|nr:type II toxin-antitoxin system VapC family toxin [Pseudomonadota bacterium]